MKSSQVVALKKLAILCCCSAMFFPYILMNWCISIISKSKKYNFLRLFSLTCKLFLWQTWFYSLKRLYWLTSVLNTFQNQNFKRRSFLCVLLYFIRFHRFIQFFELDFYIWKKLNFYIWKMLNFYIWKKCSFIFEKKLFFNP